MSSFEIETKARVPYYENFDWYDINYKIRLSLTVLGYNFFIWNNEIEEGKNEIQNWDDLNENEKILLYKIGYNKKGWDRDYDENNTNTYTVIPEKNINQNINKYLNINIAEIPYYFFDNWDEIDINIQIILTTLGYNQDIWDTGKDEEKIKDWEQYSTNEKELISQIGFNNIGWDGQYNEKDSDTFRIISKKDIQIYKKAEIPYYDYFSWEQINVDIRFALIILGYNQIIWDIGEGEENIRDWDDLNENEKDLLKKIGYNKKGWDYEYSEEVPNTFIIIPKENIKLFKPKIPYYINFKWLKINKNIRRILEKFGYNKKRWEDGKIKNIKKWDEMNLEEKVLLVNIGYDKKGWRKKLDKKNKDEYNIISKNDIKL